MSNMDIGSRVLVHPQHSLRFGGKWGRVTSIKSELKDSRLVYGLMLNGVSMEMFFDFNELVSQDMYLRMVLSSPTGLVKVFGDTYEVELIESSDLTLNYGRLLNINTGQCYDMEDLVPVTYCVQCGAVTSEQLSSLCNDCLNERDIIEEEN